MSEIKNIIFDLGGVILNLNNQLTEDAFVARGVENFRAFFGPGHAASFFRDYELGKIGSEEFISNLRKLAGIPLTDEDIVNSWNAMLLDFPHARITLLQTLAVKYRLFLFSNTNALHLSALEAIYDATFDSGKLEDHFERSYYSHVMKLRKPEKASYLHIIDENGLNPAETLFVDDAFINIEGAVAAGLKGFWLKPGTTLLDIDWNDDNLRNAGYLAGRVSD